MSICSECKVETPNPKFCSRSCAVRFNNRIVGNRHGTGNKRDAKNPCLNCGIDVGAKSYCSLQCQHAKSRSDKIEAWLAGELSHLPRFVKSVILEEQNHRCSICSMMDEWQGKPIVFILDHIDGNSENNDRTNLRVVCPNCDSQLPTYKAKNKGNGRFKRRQRYAEGKSY